MTKQSIFCYCHTEQSEVSQGLEINIPSSCDSSDFILRMTKVILSRRRGNSIIYSGLPRNQRFLAVTN